MRPLLWLACAPAALALAPPGCFHSADTAARLRLEEPTAAANFLGSVTPTAPQYVDVVVSGVRPSLPLQVLTLDNRCKLHVVVEPLPDVPQGKGQPCTALQVETAAELHGSSAGLVRALVDLFLTPDEPAAASNLVLTRPGTTEQPWAVRFGMHLARNSQCARTDYRAVLGNPPPAETLSLPTALATLDEKAAEMGKAVADARRRAVITNFPETGTLATEHAPRLTRRAVVALVTGFVLGPASVVVVVYALGSRELAQTSNWISNQIFGRAQSWADTWPGRTLQLLAATTLLALGVEALWTLWGARPDAWDSFVLQWLAAWALASVALYVGVRWLLVRLWTAFGGPVLDRALWLLKRPAPPPPAHLSGPALAAYLRFQAERQSKPSMAARLGGVFAAAVGSGAALVIGAAALTLEALDTLLGVTNVAGTLFGWVPGLGLPTRALGAAHLATGLLTRENARRAVVNGLFWGAPLLWALFYGERESELLPPLAMRMLGLLVAAALAAAHLLCLWHVIPAVPDNPWVRSGVDLAVYVAFLVVLPLWIGYGLARVIHYPRTTAPTVRGDGLNL